MIAVITGDLIHSRKFKNPLEWMLPFKKLLSEIGLQPEVWEIYRGDSFQIVVKQPETVLLFAIRLKATIKCIRGLDVRMGIGIGTLDYKAARVSESNGEAFVFSGEKFDRLKVDKQNLAIKTMWNDFDNEMNLYLRLALIVMDDWTVNSAEFVSLSLQNQKRNQQALAELLGISQSSVSERQKRAHLLEILDVEMHFRSKILKLIQSESFKSE